MKQIRSYLPLLVGIIILVVIGFLAPWDKVLPLLGEVTWDSFAGMLALGVTYYIAKAVRFWMMLKLLDINKPLRQVALVYMAAQPMSLLPAGELFRTVLLEREVGVSAKKTAPTVTMQGLIEAVVLLGFSLVGAFLLGHDRLAVVAVAVVVALLLVALRKGWLLGGEKYLNKLPYINVRRRSFNAFIKGHQRMLSGPALSLIVGMSVIPVLCGIGIFYLAAHAVGAGISLAESGIGYSLPVIISGLSFLPGGVGASEGGTLGLLTILGVTAAKAVAITLLVRVFTLGTGIILGLAALIGLQIVKD